MSWRIVFTKQAEKDKFRIASAGLKPNVRRLLDIMKKDPFSYPPPYEKLVGDLAGAFSRRINIQHRLVYEVIEAEHTVKIVSMWLHYE